MILFGMFDVGVVFKKNVYVNNGVMKLRERGKKVNVLTLGIGRSFVLFS